MEKTNRTPQEEVDMASLTLTSLNRLYLSTNMSRGEYLAHLHNIQADAERRRQRINRMYAPRNQ